VAHLILFWECRCYDKTDTAVRRSDSEKRILAGARHRQESEMPITVDARGLSCPRPRQMTIEAIRSAKQGDVIVVLVDGAAARDSIIRLAKAFQFTYNRGKGPTAMRFGYPGKNCGWRSKL
jgi:TusA-related sulfurtransferase